MSPEVEYRTGLFRLGFAGLGEDDQGELYFCSNDTGIIFTLAPQP